MACDPKHTRTDVRCYSAQSRHTKVFGSHRVQLDARAVEDRCKGVSNFCCRQHLWPGNLVRLAFVAYTVDGRNLACPKYATTCR